MRLEFIDGRMTMKALPDGNHNRIVIWLLLLSMPRSPGLFLHQNQGLMVESDRCGRARPDGVLAPLEAFVGTSKWAPSDQVITVVEVTSRDSETNRRDRIEKPRAFAQSGIPIYLLIDRDNTEVVVYSNSNGEVYQQVCQYAFGLQVRVPVPLDLTIDTAPLQDWVD
ncbi:Uma2 family endonuclease [Nocardia sp. JMUB6875]